MDAAEFDRKRSGRGPGADEEATGGTGGDGRPWPTRPALVAACVIAAGVVLAAWLVRAAGVSAEAVSTVLYGAGFLAAVLAVGVVLLLLVGTVEVMFKRRASRAGMVAGMSFLAAALAAIVGIWWLVLSWPGPWLANLRQMVGSGGDGRLFYPVLLALFSQGAGWLAWVAAVQDGHRRLDAVAVLPYVALPNLGERSFAEIAAEVREEARADDERARRRVAEAGRPFPVFPPALAVVFAGFGVALPAVFLVKGNGSAAATAGEIVLSSVVLAAALLLANCIAALVAGTLGAFRARRCMRAGAAAGALLLAASPAFLAGFCALLYGLPVCGFAGLYRAGAADVGTLPAAAIALVYMLASFWLVMELWNYALRRPEAAGWRLLALPEAVLSRLGVCSSGDIAGAVRAIAAEKAAKDAPWFYYC